MKNSSSLFTLSRPFCLAASASISAVVSYCLLNTGNVKSDQVMSCQTRTRSDQVKSSSDQFRLDQSRIDQIRLVRVWTKSG